MYTLPDLPYDYDALGPHISGEVMKLHHDKHHQTYVDKLNTAMQDSTDLQGLSLVDILRRQDIPDAIRNNGGGHYNHALFWQWMSPSGGGEPTGDLNKKIVQKYGSFQKFVDEFSEKSIGIFGSGWAWLQPDMEIITTPNQDTPMRHGLSEPILGLDVWEHAYYLDYKNVRADYIKAWWDVVDWQFVTTRLEESHK